MFMRVAIIMADSNGGFPVPASKGGAVSTLVEHIINENEKFGLIELQVVSIYDREAEQLSKKYSNTCFTWVKTPAIIKWLDKLLFDFVRTFLKKKKAISYKSIFSLIYTIVHAANWLKHNDVDKVILENNIPLAWVIKLSQYRGEYYYHFHNVPRLDAKCRSVFDNCNAYLCVSNYVASKIMASDSPIGSIQKKKLKVLYNCIDTSQFVPVKGIDERNSLRRKYNLAIDDKVICFVGRLSEEKGVDKLLEAVADIPDDKLKIIIVGSLIHNSNIADDYLVNLHRLAAILKDRVIFTGYIPQIDVHEIYQMSDLAVLPSIWDEPAGLTMVEALACGISVVTTDSGGIPEYMRDNAIVLKRDNDLVQNIRCAILGYFEKPVCRNLDMTEYSPKKYYNEFLRTIGM